MVFTINNCLFLVCLVTLSCNTSDVLIFVSNFSVWTLYQIFNMQFSRYIVCSLNQTHLRSLRFVNCLALNSSFVFDSLSFSCFRQMEMERFELLTPCLQGRCSPNWATPPLGSYLVPLSAFRLMGLSGPYLLSEGLAFKLNGLKWTRTTDLTLIRRAL